MGRSILERLKPYYIKKALRYLRHYGPRDFLVRVRERLTPEEVPYGPWYEKHRADQERLKMQRKRCADLKGKAGKEADVLFSILVPCYRTPEGALRELIVSVKAQSYPGWELLLANASPEDDSMSRILREEAEKEPRIHLVTLQKNEGIAENTNAAARAARGDFFCFLDHDDLIAPDALYEAWSVLTEEKSPGGKRDSESTGSRISPDLLYTDEDKIRQDPKGGLSHFQPHFKPDFNLDLLRANNYICHFLMVRRELFFEVGGLNGAFEGAQDYEFILRCVDRLRENHSIADLSRKIRHIPKVLYSWRISAVSTADNPVSKSYAYEAGQRALEEHFERCGIAAEVSQKKDHGFYRVKYPLTSMPMVSILIPNCEEKETLEKCITALWDNTDYEKLEIIVLENHSHSREILDYYREIQGKNHVRVIRRKTEGPFSFSDVNNYGVRHAKGDYLLFLNNDVAVKPGWLREMLSVCLRPEVGAVGGKLYYPDGKVQSAGVIVGIGGVAGSLFTGMNGSFSGYLHRASTMQDLSAVTGAMMMVRRSAFEEVGGFSMELPVAFNDVDLCLKLRKRGYLVVFDPYAEAVHDESRSRGDEYTKEKAERYRREAQYMHDHWGKYYETGDPYYNPNLSLARWDYTLET